MKKLTKEFCSNASQIESYRKIIAAATDTDIFATLLYHYHQWIHEDYQELWMLYDQGVSSRILPIHQIANYLESHVIGVLPAVHALTACDSTS